MKNIAEKVLKYSDDALKTWEQDNISLDDILDKRELRKEEIRGTVSDLLFSYFRNKSIIDMLIASLAKKIQPPLKRIAAIAMTQLFYQTGIDQHSAVNVAVEYTKKKYNHRKGGFINGVLRNALRLDFEKFVNSQSVWVQLNIPKKLYHHWCRSYSKDVVAEFAAAFREKPVLTFRVKGSIPDAELSQLAAPMTDLPSWADPLRFYRCHAPARLFKHDWLAQGKVYIQDPSTVHAPLMLEGSFKRILDVCAAPGGKSLVLSEQHPQATLVINDRSPIRHRRTIANFSTPQVDAGKRFFITVSDALELPFKPNYFDAILLDVPCSNTGVIRHKADVTWRHSQKRLMELVELQRTIVECSLPFLKPGGVLIYSTCSIEPQENSQQIDYILKRHSELLLQKQSQLLPSNSHDGAFAAILLKS